MAGFIPKDFIQDLVARADIQAVVDQRVPLKKAGRNYQACCPFHSEKTPSFTVAPDKQFYHCFGCQAHGNAIDFIMAFEGLEFPDAVEVLASEMGLDVPRERRSPQAQARAATSESDFELMQSVARFYETQLRTHAQRHAVIDYLKNRGITGQVAKEYGLGFAPESWHAVLNQFGQTKQKQEQLLALKIIHQGESGKRFDFFRNRIMFPIRDRRGRVVGFGGRVLEGDGPKYLNSPETRLFRKGHELYGFYEMKQRERTLSQVIIVEGYMDVVALAQYDIHHAVATLGTAATKDQLALLFRQSPQIICCFDGDQAGRDAAWRVVENALSLLKDQHDLRFLFLPEGEDPDSIVRKEGQAGFLKRLEQAEPFRQYFYNHLSQTLDLSQDAGKGALINQAQTLINQIPSVFYQNILLEELAYRLGRDISQLDAFIQVETPKNKQFLKVETQNYTPVERAIGLLIQHPKLGRLVPVNLLLEKLKLPKAQLFVTLHKQANEAEQTTAQLLERWRATENYDELVQLALWDHQIMPDSLEQEFSDTYLYLIDRYLEQRYETLSRLPPEQLTKERLRELDKLIRTLKRR